METSSALVQVDNSTNMEVCDTIQPAFMANQRLSNPIPSLPQKQVALAPISAVEAWYTTSSTGARLARNFLSWSVLLLILVLRSSDEIIRHAYNEAKAIFSTELTKDESKLTWLRDKTCMADIIALLADLQQKYDNKPESKARKWLATFSRKIVYYGTVLDVLVQQYPEYVSLAWGTMKFLFIVSAHVHSLL
jgi:hypothetical protein